MDHLLPSASTQSCLMKNKAELLSRGRERGRGHGRQWSVRRAAEHKPGSRATQAVRNLGSSQGAAILEIIRIQTPPRTVKVIKDHPMKAALEQQELGKALTFGVYESDTPTAPLDGEENIKKELASLHSNLFDQCTKLPIPQDNGELGVPLALVMLNGGFLGEAERALLQRIKQNLCSSGENAAFIKKTINELITRMGNDPLGAMASLSSLYRKLRPVMSSSVLCQLSRHFREILPTALKHCDSLLDKNPNAAFAELKKMVLTHIDLLCAGSKPDEDESLKTYVSHTIRQILEKNLLLVDDKALPRDQATHYSLLVNDCQENSALSEADAQALNERIMKKSTDPFAQGEAEIKLKDRLDTLLNEGNCREALTVCVSFTKHRQNLRNSIEYSGFNKRMKSALEGTLASICLQLGTDGLTPNIVQDVQRVFEQLRSIRELPWVIGLQGYCVLNSLHQLVLDKVLKRNQKNSPVTPCATSSSDNRQKATPTGIKARADKTTSSQYDREITEEDFRSMFASPLNAKNFQRRMVHNREEHLSEGIRWMTFLKKYYSDKTLPALDTPERKVLEQLITGAGTVVIHDLFQQTKKASVELSEGYSVCGDVARQLVKLVCPLQTAASTGMKNDYVTLKKIVYARYLIPLKDNIIDMIDKGYKSGQLIEYDKMWNGFSEAHEISVLYDKTTWKCLSRNYTRTFPLDPYHIKDLLSSMREIEIMEGVSIIETRIFDKHRFYCKYGNFCSFKYAQIVVSFAFNRLEELIRLESWERWLPVETQFRSKYKRTVFLRS